MKTDRESILKAWDSWVKYYKAGGGASWPRDAFESLLDYFDEQISQVSDKSSGANGACPQCDGNFKHSRGCSLWGDRSGG